MFIEYKYPNKTVISKNISVIPNKGDILCIFDKNNGHQKYEVVRKTLYMKDSDFSAIDFIEITLNPFN